MPRESLNVLIAGRMGIWNSSCKQSTMHLPLKTVFLAGVLLCGSLSTTEKQPVPQVRAYSAIVQSVRTGIYRPATVVFRGSKATVSFTRGEQIVLALDETDFEQSEEILAIDQHNNYWAIYIDLIEPPAAPPARV